MRTSSLHLAGVGFVALWAIFGAACGDLYADPIKTEPSASESVFVDASITVQPDTVVSCPPEAVVEGAICSTTLGLTCEQGSSPDMRCNTTLVCVADPNGFAGGIWTARPSILCPTYQCPKGASATLSGMPCDVPSGDAGPPTDADELVCPMTDGVCACTTGTDPAHAHPRKWVCVTPAPTCPTARPLVGQACSSNVGSSNVTACDYGSCSFKWGMRMECKAGVWISGSSTCN